MAISNSNKVSEEPAREYAVSFPLITDLSANQQMVLNSKDPFWVTGPAGCGKSIVSLWRYINDAKDNNNNIIMIAYTKSLRKYLNCCIEQSGNNNIRQVQSLYKTFKKNGTWITQPKGEHYDEVIIDEAQDIEIEAFKAIASVTKKICINADMNQQLYSNQNRPNTEENLENILKECKFEPLKKYSLNRIYRYDQGIYEFVTAFIGLGQSVEASNNFSDDRYTLPVVYENIPNDQEISFIIELAKSYSNTNIAILLPFANEKGCDKFNDEYIKNCSVEYYYNKLQYHIDCTYYISSENMENFKIGRVHICTFKSAKGLEFDTVIIPKLHLIKRITEKENKQNSKTCDSDLQFQSKAANQDIITMKDYYVGLTRAKTNLILLNNVSLNKIQYFINMGETDCYMRKDYNEMKN